MKWLAVAALVLLAVPASAQTAVPQPQSTGKNAGPATAMTPTPDERAKQWLTLVDDGNAADAYKQMGNTARAKQQAETFMQTINAVRAPLGAMSSRELKSVQLGRGAARDGQSAIVQYESSFAHRAGAVETVSLVSEKGAWTVTSYEIK